VEDKLKAVLKAVLNLRTVVELVERGLFPGLWGRFRGCWIWGESIKVVDTSEYVIFYKLDDSIAIVM
jgi:hypothetical protein